MIKIAIKHFIYEKCINVLFGAIKRNFRTPPKFKFEVGMQLSYIDFITFGNTKRRVTIRDVTILQINAIHISVSGYINDKHVEIWIVSDKINSIGGIWYNNP